MNPIVRHLRANVIAYAALFVALGGTSYAAFALPANSVGTKQIRNHSITPIKLDPGKIAASVRAWAVIQDGTKVIASKPRARVVDWDPSSAVGDVSWGRAISRSCFPLASGGGALVQAVIRSPFRGLRAVVHFGTFTTSGQPDSGSTTTVIAVLCPSS
jgi:hypothetical protein